MKKVVLIYLFVHLFIHSFIYQWVRRIAWHHRGFHVWSGQQNRVTCLFVWLQNFVLLQWKESEIREHIIYPKKASNDQNKKCITQKIYLSGTSTTRIFLCLLLSHICLFSWVPFSLFSRYLFPLLCTTHSATQVLFCSHLSHICISFVYSFLSVSSLSFSL